MVSHVCAECGTVFFSHEDAPDAGEGVEFFCDAHIAGAFTSISDETDMKERLRTIRLQGLRRGPHRALVEGACIMESVAYVAGEAWSDHPRCASPVLAEFLRCANDALSDADRHILLPLIPFLIGSADPVRESERSHAVVQWGIHVALPTWLRLGNLESHADICEAIDLQSITDLLAHAPSLYAARDAAWNAILDSPWAAPSCLTEGGGRYAMVDAMAAIIAGTVLLDAMVDAAWGASAEVVHDGGASEVWDAAWNAMRYAARNAIVNVILWKVMTATSSLTEDAGMDEAIAGAKAEAWSFIRPTISLLQDSACDLVRRLAGNDTQILAEKEG